MGRPAARPGVQVLRFLGSTQGVRVIDERTKGKVSFSNSNLNNRKNDLMGAKVEIIWERSSIEILQSEKKENVKENTRNID